MQTRGNKVLIAVIFIFGIHLFFDIGSLMWPIIAGVLALYFYKKGQPLLVGLFVILALISIGDEGFDLEITGLLLAFLILYFGVKVLKGIFSAKEIDIDKDLPPLPENHEESLKKNK
ncbi:hypothetical protein [Bacillus piscicola]|uniref:hypothetical protein n=1 Tax=Bacillus piscicola TaxID=1632684 RepID=UPI001F0996E4|nr:hypothetical protein [Bacillus piscicola]